MIGSDILFLHLELLQCPMIFLDSPLRVGLGGFPGKYYNPSVPDARGNKTFNLIQCAIFHPIVFYEDRDSPR